MSATGAAHESARPDRPEPDERAHLIDGPWAHSTFWRAVLLANQATARRHPPGHPARALAEYIPTERFVPGPPPGHVPPPGAGARIWRFVDPGIEPPAPARHGVDLHTSMGTGPAARKYGEST